MEFQNREHLLDVFICLISCIEPKWNGSYVFLSYWISYSCTLQKSVHVHGIFFHVQCIALTLQYKQSFFLKSQRKIWRSYSNTVASNTFIPAAQTKLTPCLETWLILLSKCGSLYVKNCMVTAKLWLKEGNKSENIPLVWSLDDG